jgi:hypothetical protein
VNDSAFTGQAHRRYACFSLRIPMYPSEGAGKSIFRDIAAATGENPELALSIGHIVLLRQCPSVLDLFLHWITQASSLRLDPTLDWSIYGERPVNHRRKIFPDMVLSSPKMDLWFEHKLGCRLKSGELARYVSEASLIIQPGRAEPATGPDSFVTGPDQKRVVIFLISGVQQSIPRELLQWRHRFSQLQCGLAWCGEPGYLRWADWLWHIVHEFPRLQAEDRPLAEQFLWHWGKNTLVAPAPIVPLGAGA